MNNLKIDTTVVKEKGRIEGSVERYECSAIADSASCQKLTIRYSLTSIEEEILAEGTITGELTLECGRCLEKFAMPVNLTFTQAYPAEDPEIDLENEVRELLILNLPIKPLCREECKGICPGCGKNRNAEECSCTPVPNDPRWEKLREILKKK